MCAINSNFIAESRASGTLSNFLKATKYYPCASSVAIGSCNHGHHYGKLIACGREWCEYCGENGSLQHQTRVARWIHKVKQMQSVGYFVVTVPKCLRKCFVEHKNLSDFRRAIVRYLKRNGFNRGLVRYHWCGDCYKCNGKGCDYCQYKKTGKVFNPHLNILVDAGYLTEEFLFEFKKFVLKWFKNNLRYEHNKVVIHYQYTDVEAKKMHILKYVTRATFRFDWITCNGVRVLDVVKKYRASITFGKFDKQKLEDFEKEDESTILAAKKCPDCFKNGRLSSLKYASKPVHFKDVNLKDCKYNSGWFYFPRGDINRFYNKKPVEKIDWMKYFANDFYEYNLYKVLEAHRPLYGEIWFINQLYENGFLSKMDRKKKKGNFVFQLKKEFNYELKNRCEQTNLFD